MKYLLMFAALWSGVATAQSPMRVAESRVDGICRVKADMGGGHGSIGTGCLIAPTWVLTANHVTEGYPAKVQFRTEEIEVVNRFTDRFADCAVLKLARQPRTARVIPVARADTFGLVACMGFDHGNPDALRVFEGRAFQANENELRIEPHNSRMAEHGNSGGPVLNGAGEVISCLHSNSAGGNTYANCNAQLRRFLERIRQKTGEQILQWGDAPAAGQPPYIMPIQNIPPQSTAPSVPVQPTIPVQPAIQPPQAVQQQPRPLFYGITFFYPYTGQ